MARMTIDNITDKMINSGLTLDAYFTEADNEIVFLAQELGVETDDIPATFAALHNIVQDWMKAWVGMRVCFDNAGVNDTTLEGTDKYFAKYVEYKKIEADLRGSITYEMLRNDIVQKRDVQPNINMVIRG